VLASALRRWALSIVPTGTIVVIRRRPATRARWPARSVAGLADVAGTVAGDDTIANRPRGAAATLADQLQHHLEGKPVNGIAVLAYSGGLDTSCAIA
jgi:hypothetical protein